MKIQTNVIITIGFVLMVLLSVTAFNTFSFGASTNNTKNQSITPSITTTEKTSSPSIATNPVIPNTTTTSLKGSPYSTCTNTDNFLWNHVYNVNNGEPWGKNPGRLKITPDSQYKYGSCVTVTGQVYSIYPPPSPGRGTHDEPDGDLHFTLALDQKYWGLSNPNDPTCTPSPSHGLPVGCKNIIVEVICHKTPPASSYLGNGDYCKDVKPTYKSGQFPQQGNKLTVSGKLVLDEGEGKWNEIHPASVIH
jgi:hypothetical protein